MDDAAWAALAVALTLAGAAYTFWAFRARGAAAGTRGLALTLLPAAAWLTGTLRMFTRIVDAVTDWATSLVFSPSVWIGTTLFGIAVVLWVVGGFLHGRNAQRAGDPAGTGAVQEPRRASLSQPKQQSAPADSEFDDIEALLKKRGIN